MPESSSASLDPTGRHLRTIGLLGESGFTRLRRSHVMVVGLGGVGSHAALMLARTGIGRLTLVDFDNVTASSLNRHAVATPEDVGKPKVAVMRDHLAKSCEDVAVSTMEAFFNTDTIEGILNEAIDFVVDAVDSVGPKVVLLKTCVDRTLPVVSCMGAAGRVDPRQVRIDDISKTRDCPLAKWVRKRLKRLDVASGVTAVYSVEPTSEPLPPEVEESTMKRGRQRRSLPSFGVLPGIFGFMAAGVVIDGLTKVPLSSQ